MAVAHSFLRDTANVKLVRIKNTLMLEEIECSVGCLDEIAKHDDMEVVSELTAGSSTRRAISGNQFY
jgi:hypothetical protein